MGDKFDPASQIEQKRQTGLTTEQRLETPNPRLLDACIATISDKETLRRRVAYENQHQQRVPILQMLARRAEDLREES